MDTLLKVNHCKNRSTGDNFSNYFQFNKFQFITIVTKKLRQCYRILILTRLIVFWNLCSIWEQCLRVIIIFFLKYLSLSDILQASYLKEMNFIWKIFLSENAKECFNREKASERININGVKTYVGEVLRYRSGCWNNGV